MKKAFLLLMGLSAGLMTAQNTKNYDIAPPQKVRKAETLKLPPKPTLTKAQYLDFIAGTAAVYDRLYRQYDATVSLITSQKFEAANDSYTSMAADDFTVPAGEKWSVTEVSVNGSILGVSVPENFNVRFFANSASNLPGAEIHSEMVPVPVGSENPTLPLAAPLLLSAGTYWVSVQAVMDYGSGHQWYWSNFDNSVPRGAPFAWTNPGNGFGTACSAVWNTASVCVPGVKKDLVFSLSGTAELVCRTFTGRIVASDPTHTPRVNRDGVSSTCAAPKAYPGDFGSATHHYKSYSIKNTGATAQCVDVMLTNLDPSNQVFLVAYNNTFNPANISQNYLADTGLSTAGGLAPATMSFNIPAGATVILVASEVTAGNTFTADFTIEVNSPDCGSILKTGENGKQSVILYPNPTSGLLHVNGMQLEKASATDASGKSILLHRNGNEVNLEKFPKGTYILQLQDRDGKRYSEKVIKK